MKSLFLLPLLLASIVPLAFGEISDFTVETENERVIITGKGSPLAEITIKVWNESDDLVYERLLRADHDSDFLH